MKKLSFIMITASILAFPAAAAPRGEITTGEGRVSQVDQRERRDRNTDRAALASQKKAISTLDRLLKKHRGEENESVFLRKLAELHQQSAAIEFRIAHGIADARRAAPDLGSYRAALKLSIRTLDELVRKFPSADEVHVAYFLRGKAYEELGDKGSAKRDFTRVVRDYGEAEEAIPAHMSLAEFAIEGSDHATAIAHLKQVVKDPMNLQYPFALYKMAWSYYNLRDVPRSLEFIERQLGYYRRIDAEKRTAYGRGLDSSESAIIENSLTDLTTFYLQGFEQNKDSYSPKDALSYFRSIENGPLLGKMLSRYAKLLRAHDHDSALIDWKNRVVAGEPTRPEAIDIVMITFENLMNQKKFKELPGVAVDFVTLKEANPEIVIRFESFPKAQKQLTDAASVVQKLVLKNKGIKEAAYLSDTLARLYDTFIRIVPTEDPRVYGAHFNLAETLFEIGRHEDSVEHYRWIVDRENQISPKVLAKSGIEIRTASLRAVAARYEIFRKDGTLPDKLDAMPIASGSPRSMNEKLGEWIVWVDTHVKRWKFHEESVEHFHFDANRAIYSHRDFDRAITRLTDFAKNHRGSKFAVPSAGLVLDTHIKGEAWASVYGFTTEFLARSGWNQGAFGARIKSLSADSHYKLTESAFASGDYGAVIGRAKECIAKFKDSPRRPDCLLTAAKAELNREDPDAAIPHLSMLIREFPKTSHSLEATLLRGSLLEKRDEFAEAADDYLSYLSWNSKETSDTEKLRTRTLLLAWLSHSSSLLSRATASKSVCKGKISGDCERYSLLARIDVDRKKMSKKEAEKAVSKSYKDDDKQLRPLWAILALNKVEDLGFRDRMLAVRVIGSGWSSLDPTVRLSLLPQLRRAIPDAFKLSRGAVKLYAKLQPTESSIKRRVELIREMENTAEKVIKLGFPDLQVATLHQLSEVYQDLAGELLSMNPPKGLSETEAEAFRKTLQDAAFPFEEKGTDIRTRAFELAGKRGVDGAIFAGLAERFFETSPSQAKDLTQPFRITSPVMSIDDLLERLAPGIDWGNVKKLARSRKELDRRLGRWLLAVRDSRWREAAYFLDRIRETEDAPAGHDAICNALQAYSLASMGLVADAVGLLEDGWDDFPPESRTAALSYMLGRSVDLYSRDHSKVLLERWRDSIPSHDLSRAARSDNEALLIALAVIWGGFEMDKASLRTLLTQARGADSREGTQWVREQLRDLGEPAKLAGR